MIKKRLAANRHLNFLLIDPKIKQALCIRFSTWQGIRHIYVGWTTLVTKCRLPKNPACNFHCTGLKPHLKYRLIPSNEQVVITEGIPFQVRAKKPSSMLAKALKEADEIKLNYKSVDDMLEDLSPEQEKLKQQKS